VAGRIVKEDIEALRAQANIVDVVSDYTELRRAGKSFKGLCPFHSERTPSFTVTDVGNLYHCFGCGASGDLYDFLMRVEGLEFPEAVEAVARRTGFPLRYEQRSARERAAVGERSRLVAVTAAARDLFRTTLLSEDGVVARDYLKSRGFGRDEADRFELGYAPDRWEDLSRALVAQGLAADDLIAVGLAVRNDRGGLRDRFRGRLIFPIHDPGGDIIGFGGRVLPGLDYGDFDPPKYLNSPETALYHKSRVLYGLPQARAEIVAHDRVLVCEGYTDVIGLHQAGFSNAVATCGTAVGADHLRSLARFTQRIVLAFDGDRAGEQAVERAWEAAVKVGDGGRTGSGIELSVLELAPGTDPADLARDVAADGVRAAVETAVPVVPFLISRRLAAADLTDELGRAAALREAIAVLGREPDPDLRRAFARTAVADALGVPYDFVVSSAARHGVTLDAVSGVASRVDRRAARGTSAVPEVDRAQARLERAVLGAALRTPELLPPEWGELVEDDLTHPRGRAVWRAIAAAGGIGAEHVRVLELAEDDAVRDLVRALLLEPDPLEDEEPRLRREAVEDQVRRLLARRFADIEATLRAELAEVNTVTDPARMRELQLALREAGDRRRQLVHRED
jgi:DNA primase